jgi:hypothetical protein
VIIEEAERARPEASKSRREIGAISPRVAESVGGAAKERMWRQANYKPADWGSKRFHFGSDFHASFNAVLVWSIHQGASVRTRTRPTSGFQSAQKNLIEHIDNP